MRVAPAIVVAKRGSTFVAHEATATPAAIAATTLVVDTADGVIVIPIAAPTAVAVVRIGKTGRTIKTFTH